MKQSVIILSFLILVVGCGWAEAAQDTTNSLDINKPEADQFYDEVEIHIIQADIQPLVGTNQAGVMYQLEIQEKAAAQLGAEGPITLYGGGTLTVADEKFTFNNQKQFSASGTGNISACPLKAGWDQGIFAPCDEPVLSLTAQIDGLRAPAEIRGFGATQNAKAVSNLWFNDQEGFTISQCQGELIPGTNLGSIIMIGELKDGSPIIGGGLIETDLPAIDKSTPQQFTCAGAAAVETVTSAPEDNRLWQFEIQIMLAFSDDDTRTPSKINFVGNFSGDGGLSTSR